MKKEFIAHSENKENKIHLLVKHLESTAGITSSFVPNIKLSGTSASP